MVNQFLSLSMFIMLLAFFIILNSMSSFEESTYKDVLASITVAFSEAEVPPDVDSNIEEDVAQSFSEGSVLDRLQKLFDSQITGAKARKNRLGTEMHVRMPVDVFEAQLNAQSSDGASHDLKMMLVSLLTSNEDLQYKMEILLNLPKSPSALYNEQPDYVANAVKRVASYAQILETVGMPKPYITPGLVEGDDGIIHLYFRPYKPFTPVEKNGTGSAAPKEGA